MTYAVSGSFISGSMFPNQNSWNFETLWRSLEQLGSGILPPIIPDCFPKYSLNFIDSAGQVEGEILETLWSSLDEVTGISQAMSIAHHQETIDEYMNDSNWWKIVQMGGHLHQTFLIWILTQFTADSLCQKWSQVKKGISETQPIFQQLTECLNPSSIQKWTAQEQIANEQCGDHLKIYEVKSEKCMGLLYPHFTLLNLMSQYLQWQKFN